MKMAQKQAQHRRREDPQVAETPEGGSQVSDDAAELLEEIDCCLAEAAGSGETEMQQAKREWEEIRGLWRSAVSEDRLKGDVQYRVFRAQYAHLLQFDCCGVPLFDD